MRRILAQAELQLEAVPRLKREAADLREQLEQAQAAGVEAGKLAAVAEAQRAGEQASQQHAEARLARTEEREQQICKDLADAIAAHQVTRERLVESVGLASAAQAELKQRRVQDDAKIEAPAEPSGEKEATGAAGTRARKAPGKS